MYAYFYVYIYFLLVAGMIMEVLCSRIYRLLMVPMLKCSQMYAPFRSFSYLTFTLLIIIYFISFLLCLFFCRWIYLLYCVGNYCFSLSIVSTTRTMIFFILYSSLYSHGPFDLSPCIYLVVHFGRLSWNLSAVLTAIIIFLLFGTTCQ